MSKINQEKADLMELTGCDNWEMFVDTYAGKTVDEIEAICNRIWHQDNDNTEFAQRIFEVVIDNKNTITDWIESFGFRIH